MAVTRTHFTYRIDLWDCTGENIVEHIGGVEDYQLALAAYRLAVERWPGGAITLRQGARVIEDSRPKRFAWGRRAALFAPVKRKRRVRGLRDSTSQVWNDSCFR